MLHIIKTSLLIALACISTANSAVTFNFTYTDVDNNSGFGFDDSSEGLARRDTVEAVAAYINTVIDHTASVDITWRASTNAPRAGNLASMGTSYFQNRGVSAGLLHQHITTGRDPTGFAGDGSGQVNFGRDWHASSSLTTSVGTGKFDLFTVVLHELTHALGFASGMTADGSSEVPGTYTTYDTFLRNSEGGRFVDDAGNFVGDSADLTSGDVTILTDDGEFAIHAPSTFSSGSSISHLDFSLDAVMNPAIGVNIEKRQYRASDLAILAQLGYNLRAIPEPSSAMLVGVGFLGIIFYRRK